MNVGREQKKKKIIPVWMMANVSGGALRSAAQIVSPEDNSNISSVSFILRTRTPVTAQSHI